MAGSRDWFIYTADNGLFYSVNLDESNAEAAGFPHLTIANINTTAGVLPKNLKMRFIRTVNQAEPNHKRVFYINNQFNLAARLAAGTIAAPVYPGNPNSIWTVTTYKGEARTRLPNVVDTGLNDGDLEG